MTSLRKITSSRTNGAKSRGPVTAAGKAASARNSLRHGMLAQTVVLEGESQSRFIALLESLMAEYSPVSESEVSLVEAMAVAQWRRLRVWAIEKCHFVREMARHPGSPPMRAAVAFRELSDSSRSLDVISRYESRFERQYASALRNLLDRQARRRVSGEEPYPSISLASGTWEESWDQEPSNEDPPTPDN